MSRESGNFSVLHLSDVHATAGELLYGQVDGLGRLHQVAEYVASAGMTPEAVIVTGDIVQRGNPAAYPAVNAALRRLSESVGAPVFTILGNHDCADASRSLDGHADSHYRVVHVGETRVVLLDSSTGSIDAGQLRWLGQALAEPYGRGTVLALHHSPVPSPIPTLSKTGLRNADEFAEAIAGSDVRVILAGHYHHPMAATFHGVPVFVGPSLAYHQVMNAGPDRVSGHDLAMFALVHLTDGGVSSAPLSLSAPEPLFSAPAPSAPPAPLPVITP